MDLILVAITDTGGMNTTLDLLSTGNGQTDRQTYPTLIPSSISVGARFLWRFTTNLANCFTWMTYFGCSVSASIILVQRATCDRQTDRRATYNDIQASCGLALLSHMYTQTHPCSSECVACDRQTSIHAHAHTVHVCLRSSLVCKACDRHTDRTHTPPPQF